MAVKRSCWNIFAALLVMASVLAVSGCIEAGEERHDRLEFEFRITNDDGEDYTVYIPAVVDNDKTVYRAILDRSTSSEGDCDIDFVDTEHGTMYRVRSSSRLVHVKFAGDVDRGYYLSAATSDILRDPDTKYRFFVEENITLRIQEELFCTVNDNMSDHTIRIGETVSGEGWHLMNATAEQNMA